MDRLPFVSIIVPVYNAEKTIGACIESLLSQDYPKDRYEIIVADNGSRDGTRRVCMEQGASSLEQKILPQAPSPLLYLFEPIRGSYKARNAGIKEAKGGIIAFTDSDCVADKEWLKNGIVHFSDEGIGCVAGKIESFKPENYIEKYLAASDMLSQRESSKFFGFLPYAQTANAFYRMDVFSRIGYFEEKWVSGGDADFCWRMQLKTVYKLSFVDTAVIYHQHRNTVRAMFGQVMKNGEGNVLLYKKYSKNLKKQTLKESTWILLRLLVVSVSLVNYTLRKIVSMDKTAQKRYLDKITFLARELGRIKGSFKNRIIYI